MRIFALFLLLACTLIPAYAQQKATFPTDGNGMLDACGALVEAADLPSAVSALNGDRFAEKMGQFNWCAGYLGAIQDIHIQNEINLGIFGMAGLTLEGPEKLKQYAFESLRGPCIPDRAPILQLARVLVKWLREHPERLHELKGTLTTAALKDAFPCEQPSQKEAAKPAAK